MPSASFLFGNPERLFVYFEIILAIIKEKGDDAPIAWLHRSERFAEKLATPDVTVADIIGDVDPIKAANLKLSYADDRVIHYGMIPRANRCIFVINELPDLQARIQVALFNILQEGDIQIRGFKLRLLLDMQFLFTANPEDYTNRGSIVTPLKDRIGSQILTHYPEDIETALLLLECYTEKGQFDVIEKKTDALLQIYPTQPQFYYYSGLALNQKGVFKKAKEMLEIGLGCDMDYGPGASVSLWKDLFPAAELWEA